MPCLSLSPMLSGALACRRARPAARCSVRPAFAAAESMEAGVGEEPSASRRAVLGATRVALDEKRSFGRVLDDFAGRPLDGLDDDERHAIFESTMWHGMVVLRPGERISAASLEAFMDLTFGSTVIGGIGAQSDWYQAQDAIGLHRSPNDPFVTAVACHKPPRTPIEFADTQMAYQLSDPMIRMWMQRISITQFPGGVPMGVERGVPTQLVYPHAVTGEMCMFIGSKAGARAGGMEEDPEGSDWMLQKLLDIATVEQALHEHAWEEGDLVLWDASQAMAREEGAGKGTMLRYGAVMDEPPLENPALLA